MADTAAHPEADMGTAAHPALPAVALRGNQLPLLRQPGSVTAHHRARRMVTAHRLPVTARRLPVTARRLPVTARRLPVTAATLIKAPHLLGVMVRRERCSSTLLVAKAPYLLLSALVVARSRKSACSNRFRRVGSLNDALFRSYHLS